MKIICRNCQSTNIFISNRGSIAPFFMKRVHGIYLTSLEETIVSFLDKHPKTKVAIWIFNLFRSLPILRKIFKFRSRAVVDIRICRDCKFVGPDYGYEQNQLSGLYLDYRSESYNRERINFEPSYASLKDLIGKSAEEVSARLGNVSRLIAKHVDVNSIRNVLDWGGGEGKFVPAELRKKSVWILDISTEKLINSEFVRVDEIPANTLFDFVQICHVLEHVASPYDLMVSILPHIKSGGYIYIEVPKDRSDQDIERLLDARSAVMHTIHEHLNLFTAKSIKALGKTLNLRVLSSEEVEMNLSWLKATHVSGLFMKP
jgi:hypothetical protein